MEERTKGILLFLLTAIMWSTSGVLIKIIDWNPFAISGIRSGIAAVTLSLFTVGQKGIFNFSRAKIGAVLTFSITVILFVVTTKMTTAANAIIIQYTAPIYPAIFGGVFLKEKTTLLDWFFIFLVLCGIVLFFLDKLTLGGYIGNFVSFASGISFGWFYIFMRKLKNESPVHSAFLGNLLAFFICIPFIFSNYPSYRDFIFLIILGVFQMGIPMLLYSKGITFLNALDAILISTLEPILNPTWVYLFIGEKPGKWAFVGAAFVLGSLIARTGIKIKR